MASETDDSSRPKGYKDLSEAEELEIARLYAETDTPAEAIGKQFGIGTARVGWIAEKRGAEKRAKDDEKGRGWRAVTIEPERSWPVNQGDFSSQTAATQTESTEARPEREGAVTTTAIPVNAQVPGPVPHAYHRVNVNFSDQAYETLEKLARQTGKSMSEVLREAIALKAWFERTRVEGGRVLVERRDGKIREVISV